MTHKRTFTKEKKVFIIEIFLFIGNMTQKFLETYYQIGLRLCESLNKIGGRDSEKK